MSVHLDNLNARAGASDQDRELWLQERTLGLTATQAKELMKGVDPFVLAADKLLDVPLEDNKYMAWGRKREPVIAQYIEDHLVADMKLEHRLFKSAANPRHLASPDMIKDCGTHLEGGEIKASKLLMTEGSEVFEQTGYFYQMQWQAYVCDFERVFFAFERHNGQWVGGDPETFPEPEVIYPVEGFWVERDEIVIQEMIERADEFLDIYDSLKG